MAGIDKLTIDGKEFKIPEQKQEACEICGDIQSMAISTITYKSDKKEMVRLCQKCTQVVEKWCMILVKRGYLQEQKPS